MSSPPPPPADTVEAVASGDGRGGGRRGRANHGAVTLAGGALQEDHEIFSIPIVHALGDTRKYKSTEH